MPGTCAPSTAERMPLLRASAQSSLAGRTTPVKVLMWLKKKTRVRGVMASLNRVQDLLRICTGLGSVTFFTTIP